MIFDDKLQWGKDVEHVKERVIKRLILLKCLFGLQWGADQDVLLQIHQALILSVIEYETVAYGSARKSILEKLNLTHHKGLRIALRAFRSTRIENLICEAGSSTLDQRRLLITAKTAIRTMTINEHPIKNNLEDPTTYDQYANRIRITKPFYIREMGAAVTLNIDYQWIRPYFTSFHPPWMLKHIRPDTEMLSCRPRDNNNVKKESIHRRRKMDEKTGYAVITPNRTLKIRLTNEASVYTAELSAISQALSLIKKETEETYSQNRIQY
jgi:hypothetical protein